MLKPLEDTLLSLHDFRIVRSKREKAHFYKPLGIGFRTPDSEWDRTDELVSALNKLSKGNQNSSSSRQTSAQDLFACELISFAYQSAINAYLEQYDASLFSRRSSKIEATPAFSRIIRDYSNIAPSASGQKELLPLKIRAFYVWSIQCANPAFMAATKGLVVNPARFRPEDLKGLRALLSLYTKDPSRLEDSASFEKDLYGFLSEPAWLFPNSLSEQIDYIVSKWTNYLPDYFFGASKFAQDLLSEAHKPHLPGPGVGEYGLGGLDGEAHFSNDDDWMPNVVMAAKNVLVWLSQLSRRYARSITKLSDIPDAELDEVARLGINTLWLIGIWRRSPASKEIKKRCGNTSAEASAYSIYSYEIAGELGGWEALDNLLLRCRERGIRLAADLVSNHTGIDSLWVEEHPEYFLSDKQKPFASYTYNSADLSSTPDVTIKIEDHYYSKTDAAVAFMRRDNRTGEVRYIYHGNDGTSMPWNDTAQLDYLNPTVREAVIDQTLQIAKRFSVIRFDAAMTLASRHIQRLWYPEPGKGGDIAGRARHSLSTQEFKKRLPTEFWRSVVDRVSKEAPSTLLLAEAFWMMEGYFVRTLGMHRVYNSAFMNLLKSEENAKHRNLIKEVLASDPEILRRYVNFMNNPDEETASVQFGDGDKYFGVATLLSTMPGLPMWGHGQFEGLKEKYGMEFSHPRLSEERNDWLYGQHLDRIVPLLKMRCQFSGVENFELFDFETDSGVNENVYAYINGRALERFVVIYNNSYETTHGRIYHACPKMHNDNGSKATRAITLGDALSLKFSGGSFLVWTTFRDGKMHVAPAMEVSVKGLEFTLAGYETQVLMGMMSIEDSSGQLEALWKKHGTGGFDPKLLEKGCEEELSSTFGAVLGAVKARAESQKGTVKLTSAITEALKAHWQKEADYWHKRGLEFTLPSDKDLSAIIKRAFKYTPAEGVKEAGEILKEARQSYTVDPASAVSDAFFHSAASMIPDYSELIALVLALLPTLPYISGMGASDTKDLSNSLYVKLGGVAHYFARGDADSIANVRHERLLKLVICGFLSQNEQFSLNNILKHMLFIDLIGYNEYDCMKWYAQEKFEEALIIMALFRFVLGGLNRVQSLQLSRLASRYLAISRSCEYKLDRLTDQSS